MLRGRVNIRARTRRLAFENCCIVAQAGESCFPPQNSCSRQFIPTQGGVGRFFPTPRGQVMWCVLGWERWWFHDNTVTPHANTHTHTHTYTMHAHQYKKTDTHTHRLCTQVQDLRYTHIRYVHEYKQTDTHAYTMCPSTSLQAPRHTIYTNTSIKTKTQIHYVLKYKKTETPPDTHTHHVQEYKHKKP